MEGASRQTKQRCFGEARGMNAATGKEGMDLRWVLWSSVVRCRRGCRQARRRRWWRGDVGMACTHDEGDGSGLAMAIAGSNPMLVTPSPGRVCGCGVHCCDVCCNSAIARVPAAQGGRRRLSCLLPGGSKGERGERKSVFVWHGALSGSQQKAKKANAKRCIQKQIGNLRAKFCCKTLCFSGDLLAKFSSVSRHMLIRV